MVAEPRFHQVRVSEVITETPDACSLVLEVADEIAGAFAYRPGQFLTLRIPGGSRGPVARCYSLASSPHTGDALKVTVKRVFDGYGSNWICDNIVPGAVLDALPPAGIFTPRSLDGDFLLFAGGSGITPVISIVKSVLSAGSGRLVLIYANRDERSVIFADELRQLAADHPQRLTLVHWLESVQGLPTAMQLRPLARPYAAFEHFVCGPEEFMAEVAEALRQLDVPRGRVHVERFLSLSEDPFEEPVEDPVGDAAPPASPAPAAAGNGSRTATLDVELDGQRHRFTWPGRTKLLDLLLDEGLDAPYSCREGACSACACRIEEGEVTMLRNEVLEEEDIAEGYVLACQALPVTDIVKVNYD
jgi:3-ketosteroid 9alpha-monooxygenase subunit B